MAAKTSIGVSKAINKALATHAVILRVRLGTEYLHGQDVYSVKGAKGSYRTNGDSFGTLKVGIDLGSPGHKHIKWVQVEPGDVVQAVDGPQLFPQ